ncbi:MAG: hypothetical protein U9Q03_00605, partial [Patescibacteria group bacterium]|nr:hypothetical protein [Patescibacteria group bacterium]
MPVEAAACATGADITLSTDCTWDTGTHTYTGTLTINSGVTVTAGNASTPALVVVVAEDVDVQGIITNDGMGSACSTGTGQGGDSTYPSGAGYGGLGGNGNTDVTAGGAAYGDVTTPDDIGSGGGHRSGYSGCRGGAGGGAFKLDASGTVTLGGTITADGVSGSVAQYGGGGSGGSVWIQAGTITGTGTVTSDGGDGHINGGGGAGGRIAIEYAVDSSSNWATQAGGGDRGSSNTSTIGMGAAGTSWRYDGSGNGDLTIGGGDRTYPNYTDQVTTSSQTYDNITIKDGAEYRVPSSFDLTLGSSGTLTGGGTEQSRMTVASGSQFDVGSTTFAVTGLDVYDYGTIATATTLSLESDSTFVFDADTGTFTAGLSTLTVKSGTTFSVAGTSTLSLTTVDIQSGGTMTHENNSTTLDNVLDLSVTDLTVDGTIDVDDKGYDCGTGPGVGGDSTYPSGAGHGGLGGNGYGDGTAGGEVYGAVKSPDELGSAGGHRTGYSGCRGGSGGGAVKVIATGTIDIDGLISADGGASAVGYGGGGSGGSVWLDSSTITGTGTVTSNGGDGHFNSGGGGGGRIAYKYNVDSSSWAIQSYGGDRGSSNTSQLGQGAAGTIYSDDKDDSNVNGYLTLKNLSRLYANYTKQYESSVAFDSINLLEKAYYKVPNTKTIELADGGSYTGDSTGKLEADDGGTFDIKSTTFTINGVDTKLSGTISTVTNLTITNAQFEHDSITGTFDSLSDLTIDTGATYIMQGTTTTALANVTVKNGGTLTHEANSSTHVNEIDITCTSLDVESGGTIDVDGKGYGAGLGPGDGADNGNAICSGAGYGGNGGRSNYDEAGGTTYGDAKQPADLGSGGGIYSSGSNAGGGMVKAICTGTITVNGTITSQGVGSLQDGGGSGGSVWLDAGTVAGSGTVTADGGPGYSTSNGGGGGGRIALYWTNGTSPKTAWTVSAYGYDMTLSGTLEEDGGAGTIFYDDKDDSNDQGEFVVDNSDRTDSAETTQTTSKSYTFDIININNDVRYVLPSTSTLILDTSGTMASTGSEQCQLKIESGATFTPSGATSYTFDNFDVDHDGTVSVVTGLTVQNGAYEFDVGSATFSAGNLSSLTVDTGGSFSTESTTTMTIGTVLLQNGGLLTHAVNSTVPKTNELDISATTFTINDSSSAIDVDGKGYGPSEGPGQGADNGNARCSGGGYGGNGGNSGYDEDGGTTYGDAKQPVDPGSGGGIYSGGSNYGGGVVRLDVSGTLTLNGEIKATGVVSTQDGGGSGGSVWISAGTVAGAGTVSADGGPGPTNNAGGGGGGGRIAIYWTDGNAKTNWNVTAYGGNPTVSGTTEEDGGAGTIFYDDLDDGDNQGEFVADNGVCDSSSETTQVSGTTLTFDDITISGGTRYVIPNTSTLILDTSGTFTGGGASQPSLTIDSGGTFTYAASSWNLATPIDFYHRGTVATVTNFTTGSSVNYLYDTDNASFSAGLTDLTVASGGQFSTEGTTTFSLTNLSISSGGTLTHEINGTTHDNELDISATTISIDGTIDARVKGYDTGEGPGQGEDEGNAKGSGGGYGGNGGDTSVGTGGVTYGSATQPSDLGSGGGLYGASNAPGGGMVKLFATSGTFNLNGTISTDGGSGTSDGGGSGGSVWINAGTIAGTGTITADGGPGTGIYPGGGGGGRIAIYYTTDNSSSWIKTAIGGTGNTGGVTDRDGGAGTIYTKQGSADGDFVVNNGSRQYSNFTTQVSGETFTFDNITISGDTNYVVADNTSLTLDTGGTFTGGGTYEPSITVEANGTLDLSPASTIDDIAITNNGNATLATILTNQNANWINTGTIAGVSTFTCASGSCTNEGNFSGGIHTLNVGNGGNFTQRSNS